MSANGKRRPRRPRIEIVSPASDTEAAAIVAALEQFLAETAPAPASSAPKMSPWQAAALRDGIAARRAGGGGWGRSASSISVNSESVNSEL